MAIMPVRGLAQTGINRDQAPYDLPLNAWSGGTNVRFANGKAQRAPVFRTASALTPLADGAGVVTFNPATGFDTIFGIDSSGHIAQWNPGAGFVDVSGASGVFNPVSANTQFTSCALSEILYVNRETHLPRYWSASSSAWAPLPNWPTNYYANIIRSFYSFLVAFGVNKGGTNFPTLVKWSDATLLGQVPGTWDITVATNLAGETPLSQLDTPIMDANNLRNVMVIYGLRQTWLMEFTGDATYPMTFTKAFEGYGAISRNCSVEVNGMHYVFGPTDLWVHDGTTPQSIAVGRVRDWVFSNLNVSRSNRCFVYHNPVLTEVGFAFCSADSDTPFGMVNGCNKAAVYNYQENTWGFYDLPCVNGASLANANLSVSWSTLPTTTTWDNVGGSWGDQSDGYKPAPFMVGNVDTNPTGISANLYAIDPMDKNSRVSLPADVYANSTAYLSRDGIDLDVANIPLANFKLVSNIYPQAFIYRQVPVTLQMGASETPQSLPNYAVSATFDPTTQYQINSRESGRYLSMRFSVAALADFEVTGFDLDVRSGGRR